MTNHWVIARLVLLATSAASSWPFMSMPGDFSHSSASFFFIMIALVAVGTVFTLSIQKINPLSTAQWQPPSWSESPFSFREPLQVFHMAGWCFVAAGVGAFILGMSRSPLNWAWELPLSVGIGALLGVRLMTNNSAGDKNA